MRKGVFEIFFNFFASAFSPCFIGLFARPRLPRDHWDTCAYTKTIKAACRRAHIAPWGANRLRHAFATEVRRKYGLDAARAVLGHSTGLRVTDIYSRDAAEDEAIRTAAPAVEALG